MKQFLLKILNFLNFFWKLIPDKLRLHFLTALIVLESRGRKSKNSLKRLLFLKDKLEWVINERALNYGGHEHPKHLLTKYHKFFIDRISKNSNVLDVGCGYGAVARSIANAIPSSKIVGVDLDQDRLEQAKSSKNPINLLFIRADATKEIPKMKFDYIILSNILEHLNDRINFLKKIKKQTNAKYFLIRVPLFERDWQMALRRELNVNYFSDEDHKIEHTLEEFEYEMKKSGFNILEIKTLWGEIWANCQVK